MRNATDILILGADDRPLAVIELKNLPDLSPATATALRDAVVESFGEPPPYVVVASQDKGYIWAYDRESRQFGAEETADLQPIFRSYGSLVRTTSRLRRSELQLLLSGWLTDVSRYLDEGWPNTRKDGVFGDFLSKLRGARVILKTAA